jgi:hypothetical protein
MVHKTERALLIMIRILGKEIIEVLFKTLFNQGRLFLKLIQQKMKLRFYAMKRSWNELSRYYSAQYVWNFTIEAIACLLISIVATQFARNALIQSLRLTAITDVLSIKLHFKQV